MIKSFKQNLDNLDFETVKQDPYLKTIDKIWKKE